MLSQRIRLVQAARLRNDLVARHGDGGAFPAPQMLRGLDLDLPGRKAEYLRAVAEAAIEGRLDGAALRSLEPEDSIEVVREIKGLGPFGAELVVIRGANAPDALPRHEHRLEAEVTERYGSDRTYEEISRPGGRSAPGRPCTCAPCPRSGRTRSVASGRGTQPPTSSHLSAERSGAGRAAAG